MVGADGGCRVGVGVVADVDKGVVDDPSILLLRVMGWAVAAGPACASAGGGGGRREGRLEAGLAGVVAMVDDGGCMCCA